ncbi:MAG: sugar ABC transporter ATP-binding protein [Actinomycetota bacterium]|nr:sugar ABC transporter ATP-binding protein [Actinomycetota bacterium]
MRIRKLNKSFPGVKALDNIDLEIYRDEVHALVGENGAGKSTLIKLLVGAYQKDSGEIYFNNQKVKFDSPAQAFKSGISVIYQENSLIPQLNVMQNIFLGMEYLTPLGLIDENMIYQECLNISKKLGFELPPYEEVRNLGVAEQKLVEILKALIHKAKFIIMDEPTASLSKSEIEHLFQIISELKSNHVSVLYITHILGEVFRIADRITVLRDGKKINTVFTKDVNRDEVITMMVGESLKDTYISKPTGIKKGQQPALKVENLYRKPRVNGVSFEAFPGEILGITGLTGAGKTELSRLIFGADKLDDGQIIINDKQVKIRSPFDAVKNGISLIPEDRKKDALILILELYKNITLPSLEQFSNKGVLFIKKEAETAQHFIRKLDIRASGLNQVVKYLSGGNQQKVAISKWLKTEPKVLIIDEPTQGIDIKAKAEIYIIMRNLAKSGVCVIFISSEVSEIVKVSDRILILRQGRISGEFKHGVSQEEIMRIILEEDK